MTSSFFKLLLTAVAIAAITSTAAALPLSALPLSADAVLEQGISRDGMLPGMLWQRIGIRHGIGELAMRDDILIWGNNTGAPAVIPTVSYILPNENVVQWTEGVQDIGEIQILQVLDMNATGTHHDATGILVVSKYGTLQLLMFSSGTPYGPSIDVNTEIKPDYGRTDPRFDGVPALTTKTVRQSNGNTRVMMFVASKDRKTIFGFYYDPTAPHTPIKRRLTMVCPNGENITGFVLLNGDGDGSMNANDVAVVDCETTIVRTDVFTAVNTVVYGVATIAPCPDSATVYFGTYDTVNGGISAGFVNFRAQRLETRTTIRLHDQSSSRPVVGNVAVVGTEADTRVIVQTDTDLLSVRVIDTIHAPVAGSWPLVWRTSYMALLLVLPQWYPDRQFQRFVTSFGPVQRLARAGPTLVTFRVNSYFYIADGSSGEIRWVDTPADSSDTSGGGGRYLERDSCGYNVPNGGTVFSPSYLSVSEMSNAVAVGCPGATFVVEYTQLAGSQTATRFRTRFGYSDTTTFGLKPTLLGHTAALMDTKAELAAVPIAGTAYTVINANAQYAEGGAVYVQGVKETAAYGVDGTQIWAQPAVHAQQYQQSQILGAVGSSALLVSTSGNSAPVLLSMRDGNVSRVLRTQPGCGYLAGFYRTTDGSAALMTAGPCVLVIRSDTLQYTFIPTTSNVEDIAVVNATHVLATMAGYGIVLIDTTTSAVVWRVQSVALSAGMIESGFAVRPVGNVFAVVTTTTIECRFLATGESLWSLAIEGQRQFVTATAVAANGNSIVVADTSARVVAYRLQLAPVGGSRVAWTLTDTLVSTPILLSDYQHLVMVAKNELVFVTAATGAHLQRVAFTRPGGYLGAPQLSLHLQMAAVFYSDPDSTSGLAALYSAFDGELRLSFRHAFLADPTLTAGHVVARLSASRRAENAAWPKMCGAVLIVPGPSPLPAPPAPIDITVPPAYAVPTAAPTPVPGLAPARPVPMQAPPPLLWSRPLGSGSFAHANLGLVFGVLSDRIDAFAAGTGVLAWTAPLHCPAAMDVEPMGAVSHDTIVIVCAVKVWSLFAANGTLRWGRVLPSPVLVTSAWIVAGDVLVWSAVHTEPVLHGFDLTQGRAMWNTTVGSGAFSVLRAVPDSMQPPAGPWGVQGMIVVAQMADRAFFLRSEIGAIATVSSMAPGGGDVFATGVGSLNLAVLSQASVSGTDVWYYNAATMSITMSCNVPLGFGPGLGNVNAVSDPIEPIPIVVVSSETAMWGVQCAGNDTDTVPDVLWRTTPSQMAQDTGGVYARGAFPYRGLVGQARSTDVYVVIDNVQFENAAGSPIYAAFFVGALGGRAVLNVSVGAPDRTFDLSTVPAALPSPESGNVAVYSLASGVVYANPRARRVYWRGSVRAIHPVVIPAIVGPIGQPLGPCLAAGFDHIGVSTGVMPLQGDEKLFTVVGAAPVAVAGGTSADVLEVNRQTDDRSSLVRRRTIGAQAGTVVWHRSLPPRSRVHGDFVRFFGTVATYIPHHTLVFTDVDTGLQTTISAATMLELCPYFPVKETTSTLRVVSPGSSHCGSGSTMDPRTTTSTGSLLVLTVGACVFAFNDAKAMAYASLRGHYGKAMGAAVGLFVDGATHDVSLVIPTSGPVVHVGIPFDFSVATPAAAPTRMTVRASIDLQTLVSAPVCVSLLDRTAVVAGLSALSAYDIPTGQLLWAYSFGSGEFVLQVDTFNAKLFVQTTAGVAVVDAIPLSPPKRVLKYIRFNAVNSGATVMQRRSLVAGRYAMFVGPGQVLGIHVFDLSVSINATVADLGAAGNTWQQVITFPAPGTSALYSVFAVATEAGEIAVSDTRSSAVFQRISTGQLITRVGSVCSGATCAVVFSKIRQYGAPVVETAMVVPSAGLPTTPLPALPPPTVPVSTVIPPGFKFTPALPTEPTKTALPPVGTVSPDRHFRIPRWAQLRTAVASAIVTTNASWADGAVHAFSPNTGAPLWTTPLPDAALAKYPPHCRSFVAMAPVSTAVVVNLRCNAEAWTFVLSAVTGAIEYNFTSPRVLNSGTRNGRPRAASFGLFICAAVDATNVACFGPPRSYQTVGGVTLGRPDMTFHQVCAMLHFGAPAPAGEGNAFLFGCDTTTIAVRPSSGSVLWSHAPAETTGCWQPMMPSLADAGGAVGVVAVCEAGLSGPWNVTLVASTGASVNLAHMSPDAIHFSTSDGGVQPPMFVPVDASHVFAVTTTAGTLIDVAKNTTLFTVQQFFGNGEVSAAWVPSLSAAPPQALMVVAPYVDFTGAFDLDGRIRWSLDIPGNGIAVVTTRTVSPGIGQPAVPTPVALLSAAGYYFIDLSTGAQLWSSMSFGSNALQLVGQRCALDVQGRCYSYTSPEVWPVDSSASSPGYFTAVGKDSIFAYDATNVYRYNMSSPVVQYQRLKGPTGRLTSSGLLWGGAAGTASMLIGVDGRLWSVSTSTLRIIAAASIPPKPAVDGSASYYQTLRLNLAVSAADTAPYGATAYIPTDTSIIMAVQSSDGAVLQVIHEAAMPDKVLLPLQVYTASSVVAKVPGSHRCAVIAAGASTLTALQCADLSVLWRAELPSVQQIAVAGDYLTVVAQGVVASIGISNGRVAWTSAPGAVVPTATTVNMWVFNQTVLTVQGIDRTLNIFPQGFDATAPSAASVAPARTIPLPVGIADFAVIPEAGLLVSAGGPLMTATCLVTGATRWTISNLFASLVGTNAVRGGSWIVGLSSQLLVIDLNTGAILQTFPYGNGGATPTWAFTGAGNTIVFFDGTGVRREIVTVVALRSPVVSRPPLQGLPPASYPTVTDASVGTVAPALGPHEVIPTPGCVSRVVEAQREFVLCIDNLVTWIHYDRAPNGTFRCTNAADTYTACSTRFIAGLGDSCPIGVVRFRELTAAVRRNQERLIGPLQCYNTVVGVSLLNKTITAVPVVIGVPVAPDTERLAPGYSFPDAPPFAELTPAPATPNPTPVPATPEPSVAPTPVPAVTPAPTPAPPTPPALLTFKARYLGTVAPTQSRVASGVAAAVGVNPTAVSLTIDSTAQVPPAAGAQASVLVIFTLTGANAAGISNALEARAPQTVAADMGALYFAAAVGGPASPVPSPSDDGIKLQWLIVAAVGSAVVAALVVALVMGLACRKSSGSRTAGNASFEHNMGHGMLEVSGDFKA